MFWTFFIVLGVLNQEGTIGFTSVPSDLSFPFELKIYNKKDTNQIFEMV
jgi:hypothetical protein